MPFEDHRQLLSDFIARAFQLVIASEEQDRDLTADELEEISECLFGGNVHLRHLPGGAEAYERVKGRIHAERARRAAETAS